MRTVALVLSAALPLVALGVLVGAAADDDTSAMAPPALATVLVERRTLVEHDRVDGTLTFADLRALVHRPLASAPQTVTWLARERSVVGRGEPLYRVNGRAVRLLYGRVPAYRTLRPGVRGADVRQLERNLSALTRRPLRVDDRYTAATAAAVRAAGLGSSGTLRLGRAVFLPGPRRVGRHRTEVGALLAAGTEVMQTRSQRRVVDIELDASRQGLVASGGRVEVTLPGGHVVRGRIAHVGPAAARDDLEPVIDVTVAVPATHRIARLDEAPVTVALARASRREVLAVPVTALLARPGGMFALEPADPGGRLVPVDVGMAAGGYAEVSGRGLSEGLRVVAAQ